MLLDIEHLRPHPGGIPALYPGQRNKTCLFCCVRGVQKKKQGCVPCDSHSVPAALPPLLRDCPRSQQNVGFVSLGWCQPTFPA